MAVLDDDPPWWFRRSAGGATLHNKDIDLTVPSAARVYDFMLGGKDNFAVDRDVVAQMLKVVPDALDGPRMIRACLRRAVRHMVTSAGIEQFIDLGSGLPTEDNVHQVAQRHHPGSRVVYVDYDPVVVAHASALLVPDDSTTVIPADFRDADAVLAHADTRRLIDFDQPIGLIMCSVLHYVPDEDRPLDLVAAYSEAMPPGSHLFITHVCVCDHPGSPDIGQLFRDKFGGQVRTREQFEEFFTGWKLTEPGVVPVMAWRPDVVGPGGTGEVPLSQQALLGGLAYK
jgi:SAM-dependent methyltransferase